MNTGFFPTERAHLKRPCVGPECVPGSVPGPMSEVARNCLSTIRGVALFPVGAGTAGTKPFGRNRIAFPTGQDPWRLHQAHSATRGRPREVLPETNEEGRRNPRQPIGRLGIFLLNLQIVYREAAMRRQQKGPPVGGPAFCVPTILRWKDLLTDGPRSFGR
jgi:hypothetical protein